MLFFINRELMKKTKKPPIDGFRKVQFRTIGEDEGDVRICSFLYDGEDIDSHSLNVRTKIGANREPEVLIRSNVRNEFDACIIIAAIPFNGVLCRNKNENYRFRKTIIIEVTDAMKAEYSMLAGYEKILYAIIEPNVNALLVEKHAKHTDRIRMSFITKQEETNGHNFIIDLTRMVDSTSEKESVALSWIDKNWTINFEPKVIDPMKAPYTVFTSLPKRKPRKPMNNSEGNTNEKRKSYSSRNRGGYDNQKSSQSSSRTYMHREEDIFDEDGNNGSRKSYPAKSQKTIYNKNNGRDNQNKKFKSKSGKR